MALQSNELLGISGNYDLSYGLKPSTISDANVLGVGLGQTPTQVSQGASGVSKALGAAGRIGSGALLGTQVMPGVGTAIGAGIASIIELGYQIFDYNERKKEADRIAKLEAETRLKTAETISENERLSKEMLLERKQANREARRERQKEWTWREEDRQWNRNREMVSNFMNVLYQQPGLENMLLSRWRKAA